MELSSVLYSIHQPYFFSGIEKGENPGIRNLPQNTRSGDSVSFSEQAISLASAVPSQISVSEESATGSDGSSGKHADLGQNGFLQKSERTAAEGDSGSKNSPHAQIRRVEKEMKELAETLMQVMSGTQPLDIKLRLSAPIQKRLLEHSQELQNLKAQAGGMKGETLAFV
jgi:hypothetical protein